MPPRALIVEDDSATRQLLTSIVEAEGLSVDVATSGEAAIEQLSRNRYGVIVLDIVLPGISGTTLMEHMRAVDAASLERVVVVTGLDVGEIRELFPTVKEALAKPVMPARLRTAMRSCL